MNNSLLPCMAIAAGFILPAAAASAAIIDASTLNGSFESGTGADAADWQALSGFTEERIENNASDGSWGLVLGFDNRGSALELWGVAQNTGYTVSLGETFDLSFDWIPRFNWRASDAFTWELYTTADNTAAGAVSSIATGTVTGSANGVAYATITANGIGDVTGSVGQELWISFATVDPGSYPPDPQGFARMDNVSLTAVPEPSTYALLGGFAALALALLRRSRQRS
jgi:hypothetical protein